MPVPVQSTLKPRNGGDFPVVEDVDIQGGFQIVPNAAARLAISEANQKVGMLVFQQDTEEYFSLITVGSPGTWSLAQLGGVNVAHSGVAIANNPHSGLNFTGTGVTVTDDGDGYATITISGGGSNTLAGDVVGPSNANTAFGLGGMQILNNNFSGFLDGYSLSLGQALVVVGGTSPNGICFDPSTFNAGAIGPFVWVTRDIGDVVRFDVNNFKADKVAIPPTDFMSHVTVGGGFTWAKSNSGKVYKIDPLNLNIIATYQTTAFSQYGAGITYDSVNNNIWVGGQGSGLDRIAVSTGIITHVSPPDSNDVIYAGGFIWTGSTIGNVYKIDPVGLNVTLTINMGLGGSEQLLNFVYDPNSTGWLWVVGALTKTFNRINLNTNAPDFSAGNPVGGGIEQGCFDGTSVWYAAFDAGAAGHLIQIVNPENETPTFNVINLNYYNFPQGWPHAVGPEAPNPYSVCYDSFNGQLWVSDSYQDLLHQVELNGFQESPVGMAGRLAMKTLDTIAGTQIHTIGPGIPLGKALVTVSPWGADWMSPSGDLSGNFPNPYVTGIWQNPVPPPSGINTVLEWSGSAFSWATVSGSSFTAGGDLSGTSTSQTVIKINGATVPVSGALTTGNVLQVSGAAALSYGPVNLAGGANFVTGSLPAGNQASQTMGGDVSGTTASATVTGLRGNSVPSPTGTNTFLEWTGSAFTWASASGSFTAGGDLTGTSNSQTVVAIRGNPVSATAATAGQFLVENSGASGSAWTTISGDVSASTGTPGQLTVTKINGSSVPAGGSLTTGNVLQVVGTSTLGYAAVNLGGGSSFVTGVLPTGNQAAQSLTLTGDVTGSGTTTSTSTTVGKIQGNTVTSGALTKGQFFVASSTSNWAATTLSGDISESGTTAGLLTVTGLQGNAVPSPTGTNTFLEWTGSAFTWATASGSFTAGGDLSGTSSSQTVIGIRGNSVPSPTGTNTVLEWTGSALTWGTVSSGGGGASGVNTSVSTASLSADTALAAFSSTPSSYTTLATVTATGTDFLVSASLSGIIAQLSTVWVEVTVDGSTINGLGTYVEMANIGSGWSGAIPDFKVTGLTNTSHTFVLRAATSGNSSTATTIHAASNPVLEGARITVLNTSGGIVGGVMPRQTAIDANTQIYWTLDETGSPWANTGVAGSLNLTTSYGTPAQNQTGLFGQCLDFQGSSGIISANPTSVGEVTTNITVSCWVYLHSYVNNGEIIDKSYNTSFTSPYTAVTMSTSNAPGWSAGITVAGTRYFVTSSGDANVPPLNQWCLLALTYDGTNLRSYMNGNLVGTTSTGGGNIDWGNHGPWQVGAVTLSSAQSTDGKIDDVRIESVVRSQAYFQTMYKYGVGLSDTYTITDSQVSVTAAIQGTKISPNFGAQSITTTGPLNVGAAATTSLATGFVDITGKLALEAISSSVLSNSAQGIVLFDTTTNKFLMSQNGSAYVPLGGVINVASTVTATTYTAATTDDFIPVNTTSNACTVSLPASPITGRKIRVADVGLNTPTFPITISGNGHNILTTGGSVTTTSINSVAGTLTFLFNGTTWSIL